MLTAQYLYAGYSDYFGGHGCVDNNERSEHLLYAFYWCDTTLRDIIDQLVEDSHDSDSISADISDDDIRKALIDGMLNDTGRDDYESGAIAECAATMEYCTECPECNASLTREDCDCCPECGKCFDQGESPVFIVLLTYWK